VIGFGASGRAAATALLREGAEVRVSEARAEAEVRAADTEIPAPDVEVAYGGHAPEHLAGATLVVVSPGVPEAAPVITWARERGAPVWSELELGARLCRAPLVAVTGTNGKTTTTELVAAAMRADGLSARACGNVGYPFSLAATEPFDALAVEASSFQLRFAETFRPKVSVLLNLSPDHLDWHGSFERYAAAKARIHARQGPEDVHVGNRDDREAAAVSAKASCEVRWFREGRPDPGEIGVASGSVVLGEGGEVRELARPASATRPFLIDCAVAAAAGLAFDLDVRAVAAAIAAAEPGPHRGSVVAEAGAVRFVDDSKATNPHATLAALQGATDVVLIAGGLAKGVDLSPLAAAAGSLRAVVAIGEAGPMVAGVFAGLVPVEGAGSIEEAVEVAYGKAAPDGTVLLAPACASQDMFRDYRERGDRFAAAARDLVRRRSGGDHVEASPARRSHA
jgi:UDP-N-acetylmuramoylalanine--D-glutamate ligase